MPKSISGTEYNYCDECGSPLQLVENDTSSYLWLECPNYISRHGNWMRHFIVMTGEKRPPKFNQVTGERNG